MNACSGISSRRFVYLISFTTPITSISVLVPGSEPKPRCMPIGLRPAKYFFANFSLIITTVGAVSSGLSPCFTVFTSLSVKSLPCENGRSHRREIIGTD